MTIEISAVNIVAGAILNNLSLYRLTQSTSSFLEIFPQNKNAVIIKKIDTAN
ncbi:hypothetical protein OkiPb00131_48550 [Escherichia coli]